MPSRVKSATGALVVFHCYITMCLKNSYFSAVLAAKLAIRPVPNLSASNSATWRMLLSSSSHLQKLHFSRKKKTNPRHCHCIAPNKHQKRRAPPPPFFFSPGLKPAGLEGKQHASNCSNNLKATKRQQKQRRKGRGHSMLGSYPDLASGLAAVTVEVRG